MAELAEVFRVAAAERKINEISEQDIKVKILGTIVAKESGTAMIDDGSGSARVLIQQSTLDMLKEKQLVRVFGRVVPTEDGFEVRADIVQDMSSLNLEAYEKVQKLWREIK